MAKTRRSEQAPTFNENESPLYRLFSRKDSHGKPMISEFQFAAGERLRADYERAHFEPRITSSWEGERTGARNYSAMSDNRLASLSDSAIDARRRVHSAFDAVGPELSGVLYYMCCLAGGLEQAERMLHLPQRSGKAVLAIALTRLARQAGTQCHKCGFCPLGPGGFSPWDYAARTWRASALIRATMEASPLERCGVR